MKEKANARDAAQAAPPPAPPPPEVFESKKDVVSLEEVIEALQQLGELPAMRAVLGAFQRIGVARLEQLMHYLLKTGEPGAYDEFGFEPEALDRVEPIAKWFHDHYFRVESKGIENIPAEGRVLLVANHSGTLPYDGAMVVSTIRIQHPAHRRVRTLVEDFIYHLPYLGSFMSRVGAVRACQENAQRLLENDQATLVFPEGVKGIGKLFSKRYRLQRFGRGGALKLAAATHAPIVPVSIVGAEESMPLLSKVSWLARPLGLPYIPITPTMPLLGPLGLLPLPTKWFIDFGPVMDLSEYDPEALQHDRVLLNRLNEELRTTVQAMIDARLTTRKSVVFG